MNTRPIYVSGQEWFGGSIDNGGTVSVCSRTYPAFDGIRRTFCDVSGMERSIDNILVKLEGFESIAGALEENDLAFGLEEKALRPLS